MNWGRIRAIARHDIHLALRNKALVIPMAFVSTVFLVVLPVTVALALNTVHNADADRADQLLAEFPHSVLRELPNVPAADQIIYLALVHLMVPLFIVLPVMLSSVLAADSFAGERERKTLEYLLHSPVTDSELLLGKLLSAWLPALCFAYIGSIPYLIVANFVLDPIIPNFFMPNGTWLILLIGVIPGASALTLGVSVMISSKVDSFQAAYQAGPLVTFPFLGLMVAQITGGVFLDSHLLLILAFVLWALALVVLSLAVGSFRRTKLFAGSKRSRHQFDNDDTPLLPAQR